MIGRSPTFLRFLFIVFLQVFGLGLDLGMCLLSRPSEVLPVVGSTDDLSEEQLAGFLVAPTQGVRRVTGKVAVVVGQEPHVARSGAAGLRAVVQAYSGFGAQLQSGRSCFTPNPAAAQVVPSICCVLHLRFACRLCLDVGSS